MTREDIERFVRDVVVGAQRTGRVDVDRVIEQIADRWEIESDVAWSRAQDSTRPF